MKILITGGLGFIGSHLVYKLKNHEITILDKFGYSYPGYKKIYRGSKVGIGNISKLEQYHRDLNIKYRLDLIKKTKAKIIRAWSYEYFDSNSYDLILNCGSLSEAILSSFYEDFCSNSIIDGIANLKINHKCPILHISSSMVYGSWEGSIDETQPTNPVDYYGKCKKRSESYCTEDDVILRPIHVYGIGDAKFPIWMNIERQIEKNKPVNVEAADCIYIDDFVEIVKNIIANWIPGTYNISSNLIRDGQVLQKIYPKDFVVNNKLGPTGKLREMLNSSKLFDTFGVRLKYNTYEETIRDYYRKYENLRSKQ
tara:strand:+ start:2320 stop:3252 length:933 start_codon:yes stop_codon:yes gene_type:complete